MKMIDSVVKGYIRVLAVNLFLAFSARPGAGYGGRRASVVAVSARNQPEERKERACQS
jgi:hypothetical protein